jgi:TolB-like protein
MRRAGACCAAALLLSSAAAAAPAEAPAPGGRRARLAVLEIRPLGTEPVKAELLSEVALTEASTFADLEIIGRSDIAALLGFERERQVLGCAEEAGCLAEIGGALGVEYLLVGSLGRLGQLYRIDLKLVDARKARVLLRFGESVEGSEEALVATVQRGVRQLVLPVAAGAAPPPLAQASPGAEPAPAPEPAPEPPQAPELAPEPEPAPAPTVAVPLSPPALAPAPAARTSAAPAPGMDGSRRAWGWTAVGGGAALAAAGVVFGLQAQKAYQDEKSASAAGDRPLYDSSKSRAKSRALAADVCYGLGAAGVGTGVYLLLTGRAGGVAAAPAPGGAVAVVAGRF